MFRKPVQYVTIDTISRLGNDHIVSTPPKKKVVEKSEEKEMTPESASPFSFNTVDKRVQKAPEPKVIKHVDSNLNDCEKKFRGDHILWIE